MYDMMMDGSVCVRAFPRLPYTASLLELVISPQTGWVVQWQSAPHVWGSPGFEPRSGLFFLFLHSLRDYAGHPQRIMPRTAQDCKLNVIIYNQCMLLQFLITK